MKAPKIVLIVTCLLLAFGSAAQDMPNLAISNIPDSLIKGSDAVVRFETIKVILSDTDKLQVKKQYAITVLKRRGEQYLDFAEFYKEGSTKIKDIKIIYYDAQGKLIRSIKEKDIEDVTSTYEVSTISDGRLKTFDFEAVDFPVTIYAEFISESKTTLVIEPWNPILAYDIAVEKSRYEIVNTANIPLRMKKLNWEHFPITAIDDLTFELRNVKSLDDEPYGPSYYDVFPFLITHPQTFSFEGALGSFTNWNEFGHWIYSSFLADKNDLDKTAIINEIKQSIDVDHLKGRELITALYKYLQNHSRYVLITLDEGGLEPLSAQKVHEVKYGDCKALSFYMKSLLDLFDIASDYTIVKSGGRTNQGFYEDFASSWPADHVILHVPNDGDPMWLECTSTDLPAGFLGSFTDDRTVLLVNENTTQLARTPVYTAQDNNSYYQNKIVLDDNGNITAEVAVAEKGVNISSILRLNKLSQEELIKTIKEDYIKNCHEIQITDANRSIDELKMPVGHLNFTFNAKGFGQKTGEYILLNNTLIANDYPEFKKDSNRKYPICLSRGYSTTIEQIIKIPTGYTYSPEKAITIDSDYGTYSKKSVYDDIKKEIILTRSLSYPAGTYPAEMYNKIKSFFDQVKKEETNQFYIQIQKT